MSNASGTNVLVKAINCIKKVVAVFALSATLSIGLGAAAQAAPKQIDCGNIKTVQAVNLDCKKLPANPKAQEVNVRELRLIYPEASCRGFAVSVNFQKLKEDIRSLINKAAQRVGLSPALVGAVAQVESGFNPGAISPAGAIGVMQLMPSTAAGLGVNPYDPEQNIYGGAQYLRYQVDRFNGNIPKALAAYNAGPGAVEKYNGIPPYRETREYVSCVMALCGGEIN